MIKEVRNLFNKLNHVMRDWNENIGAENNAIKGIKSMLSSFYERAGKNIKNPEEFNTRVKLTDDQQDELEQIAFAAVNQDIYFEDWQPLFEGVDDSNISDRGLKSFQSMQGTFGIETYSDFINFYETMNRFKNDRYLSTIFTSEQYAELVTFAESAGLDETYVRDNAIFIYNLDGMEGLDLYDFIHDSIDQEISERW